MDSTGDGNPLLISGPPGLVPAPDPGQAPAVPADAENAQFITLPPGIAIPPEAADSAAHLIASARRPATTGAEIVCPSAPAAPQPEPHGAPGGPAGWSLVLGDSGEAVEVTGAAFLGRNPAATIGRADGLLVPVDDPAKSVSKTHALVEVESGTLYLHDLDSTNGTRLRAAGVDEIRVEPGRRIAVAAGSTVVLGDFPIRVTRPEGVPGT